MTIPPCQVYPNRFEQKGAFRFSHGQIHVEQGGLPPPARRERALGMASKKRFALARGNHRQPVASKLATASRRAPRRFGTRICIGA
jgi:hypothetical protein